MVKIVVGGQMSKEAVVEAVKAAGGNEIEVWQTSDTQGALDVKTGKADFYLGCCQTGGGGSLAMPIALVGYASCVTVATPTSVMEEAQLIEAVQNGKRCFGMVNEAIEKVVPVLVREMILKKA